MMQQLMIPDALLAGPPWSVLADYHNIENKFRVLRNAGTRSISKNRWRQCFNIWTPGSLIAQGVLFLMLVLPILSLIASVLL